MKPGDAALTAPRSGAIRVGVISLGCAKNLVDTEVMLGHLDRAGCRLVRDAREADLILINTCSFIEAAREESIRTILEVAQLKKSGRLKRIVVAGCMVQRYPQELEPELPEVDAFIGLDELDRVVASCGLEVGPGRAVPGPPRAPAERPRLRPASTVRAPATYLYDDQTPRLLSTPRWSAYVKIAEGCDHTCAFCSIPTFRGRFRSRRPESIVREVEALAARGVREISLIAQDSSHYGRDLGRREGLAELLERLESIEALRWIRVHYLYPNTVTPVLVAAMARLSRVVPYVDLPLQHAAASVLRRMGRGGSVESHAKLLARFRDAMPGVALRSTFIVGFPGETEDEFEQLLAFVERVRFDHLGVFTYSHEEGTSAGQAEDDVPAEVKEERRRRLMGRQRSIVERSNAERIGDVEEVLVEGAHPETDHLLVGRTAWQSPDVDGQVLINEGRALPGEFVRVELTGSAGYDLVGRVVGASSTVPFRPEETTENRRR